MSLFSRTKAAAAAERRIENRVRVNCPATLLMPSGNRQGFLFDISEAGARFVTDAPPGEGCSAILEWAHHEAYCRIIWTRSDMCGVQFERPIPSAIVNATARSTQGEAGRVASSERIPLGRKRSQRRPCV